LTQPSNAFADLAIAQMSRRGFIAATAALPAFGLLPSEAAAKPAGFASVPENMDDKVHVPEGYDWQRLISWGDPLFEGDAPAMPARGAPFVFSRAEQERRFGTHNDMIALFPAVWSYPWPEKPLKRAIMCVNHEAVSPFLTVARETGAAWSARPEQIEAMYACMGVSVVELAHDSKAGTWSVVKNPSPGQGRNRRITPYSQVIFDGPAANHPWIKAASAQVDTFEGRHSGPVTVAGGVRAGTMQNCAGGYTPWGTYLTAEENFDTHFFTLGATSSALTQAQTDAAFAFDQASYGYDNTWRIGGPDQFDLTQSPHGPSLYGWIVEIDPYDPDWTPRKRTAMGRKKNECATTVIAKSKQIVSYMGDDSNNQFVYKFITSGRFNPANRIANRDLLGSGKLYAARLEADGSGRWLELTLEAANAAPKSDGAKDFVDQGDVLVRAREAALRLGATKMDRPEDVQSPTDGSFIGGGSVYVMCTGNLSDEGRAGNAANPRRAGATGDGLERNFQGHMIRIDESNRDHCALTFKWDIFAVAGDPSAQQALVTNRDGERVNASSWHDGKPTTSGDRFAMPDNICFDQRGYAWVATDGTPDTFPCNDGIYVMPTSGAGPRPVKRFLTVPVGAECVGPFVTLDQRNFFCGVQHVGAQSREGVSYRGGDVGPYSTFPDGGWPRDSVIVVRRKDGGVVGT
jgi:secreted PhoX family phosphatase